MFQRDLTEVDSTQVKARPAALLGSFVLLFFIGGCGYFENPITWDESDRSSELIGKWATLEGSEEEFTANVTQGSDGLEFELVKSAKDTKEVETALFTGHLRTSNDLHVLQIDMSTYREKTEDGETKYDDGYGYQFAKVELNGSKLLANLIDIDKFGEHAESILADDNVRMGVREVSDCIHADLQKEIVAQSLPELFRESDWSRIAAIVQIPSKELEALRAAYEAENTTIEPFKKLNYLRTCIASKLPSDLIETVFESVPDQVFVGGHFVLERI